MFGRYRLLEKIGQGGMAVVYRAEVLGIGGFSRGVALKVLHAHMAESPEFSRLFISEARLGGYLAHPNVVATLDFGQHDGRLYLAMELVDGPTLEQVLRLHALSGAPPPLDITFQILAQVCRGLQYAHSATDPRGRPLHLVHRDLKPSNILISRHGIVKVADFGVARSESNVAQTQCAGALRGTPLYLSPEQAWGRKDLDHRADLFSLGLVLFEMLTLSPLYRADTPERVLRNAQDARVEDALTEIPVGPFQPLLREFLTTALARDPGERFQSASAMGEALEKLSDAVPGRTNLATWLETLLENGAPPEQGPGPDSRGHKDDLAPEPRDRTPRAVGRSSSDQGLPGGHPVAISLWNDPPEASAQPAHDWHAMAARIDPAAWDQDEPGSRSDSAPPVDQSMDPNAYTPQRAGRPTHEEKPSPLPEPPAPLEAVSLWHDAPATSGALEPPRIPRVSPGGNRENDKQAEIDVAATVVVAAGVDPEADQGECGPLPAEELATVVADSVSSVPGSGTAPGNGENEEEALVETARTVVSTASRPWAPRSVDPSSASGETCGTSHTEGRGQDQDAIKTVVVSVDAVTTVVRDHPLEAVSRPAGDPQDTPNRPADSRPLAPAPAVSRALGDGRGAGGRSHSGSWATMSGAGGPARPSVMKEETRPLPAMPMAASPSGLQERTPPPVADRYFDSAHAGQDLPGMGESSRVPWMILVGALGGAVAGTLLILLLKVLVGP